MRSSLDKGLFRAGLALLVSASLLSALAVHAAQERFNNYVEEEEKPWEEGGLQLPPFPQDGNLIPFTVDANSAASFAIDAESLAVGGDGVIRFSLVIVSSSGARSVSYEGMRCSTGERRFYASGRVDGTWSEARNSSWVKIRGTNHNHHVELFSNYFCPIGSSAVRTADDARRALRSGGQYSSKGR